MPEDQTCLSVEPSEAGTRLDQFLAQRIPRLSRSEWRRQIEAGAVSAGGRPAAKGLRLSPGLRLSVNSSLLLPPLAPDPELAAGLPPLLADPAFFAFDKPAGLPCHPLRPGELGTLANAALALDPAVAAAGPKALEGGLVHRLDTQTSGLMLVARNPSAFAALRAAFADRRTIKTYLAIAVGEIEAKEFSIDYPIAHHARDKRRMVAVTPATPAGEWRGAPRTARSEIRLLRRLRGHSLIQVTVHQAQMHQIRVHLWAIGHPLAADEIYLPSVPAQPDSGLTRHALHAWRLEFANPINGATLRLEAPLPADLTIAIERLTL